MLSVILLIGTTFIILWKLGILSKLHEMWFAYFLEWFSTKVVRDALWNSRHNQYKELHSLAVKSTKPLKLLDIGTGTGPNFEFAPKRCEWTCFEPNESFDRYLHSNAEKHLDAVSLRVIHERAIDLQMFDDGTFDAVLTSFLFCSVDETKQLLKTIRRVLKPGGQFLYLEHVKAEDGSWVLLIQRALDLIWPTLLDGCILTKQTWKLIDESGFSSVKYDHIKMNVPVSLSVVSNVIIGTATK